VDLFEFESLTFLCVSPCFGQVIHERDAMALVNNPFCVRLFYSFRSAHCMILVMEFMVGGDLATLLKQVG
jgi:serine/threonine protein kinase